MEGQTIKGAWRISTHVVGIECIASLPRSLDLVRHKSVQAIKCYQPLPAPLNKGDGKDVL